MTSPWARQALAAGGHLSDDVAGVILGIPVVADEKVKPGVVELRNGCELAATLILEDNALD